MKTKNKKILFLAIVFTILALPLASQASSGGGNPPGGGGAPTKLCSLLNDFATMLQYVAGGLVVIFMIIAGILFLSSIGKPEQMGQAKKAIIAIVIGIALLLAAMSTGPIITEMFGENIKLCP